MRCVAFVCNKHIVYTKQHFKKTDDNEAVEHIKILFTVNAKHFVIIGQSVCVCACVRCEMHRKYDERCFCGSLLSGSLT